MKDVKKKEFVASDSYEYINPVLKFEEFEDEDKFINLFKAAYGTMPAVFHVTLYEAMSDDAKVEVWDEMLAMAMSKKRVKVSVN